MSAGDAVLSGGPGRACAFDPLGEPGASCREPSGEELSRGVCAHLVHSESLDFLEKCGFFVIR